MDRKMTVEQIKSLKGRRKITMLTAYDYPLASAVDKAGIDIILVGDSVANVVLGLESTKEIGMTEMVHHAKAVRRAVKRALLVGDMPFEAYQSNIDDSVKNAERFVKEAGCEAVKLEWFEHALVSAQQIIKAGIPVMGHVGLTPQTADQLGGFKVQGKDVQTAKKLIEQAEQLQEVGCFAVLLECIPDKVSEIITEKLSIPTIGIGAGPHCDGQVLVTHDMLGLFERYTPKFVKKYADVTEMMVKAFEEFRNDVSHGKFPLKEHSFSINPDELKKLTSDN